MRAAKKDLAVFQQSSIDKNMYKWMLEKSENTCHLTRDSRVFNQIIALSDLV